LQTYLITAENGAYYGTLMTLNGWSIYEVRITLNVTFCFDILLLIIVYQIFTNVLI